MVFSRILDLLILALLLGLAVRHIEAHIDLHCCVSAAQSEAL